MIEVKVLKIACFVIPFTAMFYALFTGDNAFYALLLGLGASTVLFFGFALIWHIEDARNNKKFPRGKICPNAVDKD